MTQTKKSRRVGKEGRSRQKNKQRENISKRQINVTLSNFKWSWYTKGDKSAHWHLTTNHVKIYYVSDSNILNQKVWHVLVKNILILFTLKQTTKLLWLEFLNDSIVILHFSRIFRATLINNFYYLLKFHHQHKQSFKTFLKTRFTVIIWLPRMLENQISNIQRVFQVPWLSSQSILNYHLLNCKNSIWHRMVYY